MIEFNITNNTGSPIILITLDNFNLPASTTKDMFATINGDFAIDDMIQNSEIQGLIDATDISVDDENSNVIDDVFIIDSILTTGNTKLDNISVKIGRASCRERV